MAVHRMEATEQSEIVSSPEINLIASEGLQRQLGRATLEGLMLAVPVESHPLAEIEKNLQHSIIGQADAIESIMNALNREKFRNPNRPIANLLFLGPTGVGKSETAKELARQLHGDDGAFIKIDCSSFSHGHAVTALVGAPPSYVGREQKPILDPEIIEQEKSVILFDELEKGSQELWDLMLQIMDDGEVTLTGTGQKVSFRDSIIIMTSNLGSNEMMGLLNPKKAGFQSSHDLETKVTKQQINKAATSALKNHFRPEFINRFDKRIVFSPLNDDQLGQVLDRYVEEANGRYQDAGIMLTMSPDLREKIITSNDERHQFGARPILREYDHLVESSLAKHVNTGSIPEGSTVYAVLAEEENQASGNVKFYYESNPDLIKPQLFQEPEPQEPEFVQIPFISQELVKLPE